MKITSVSVRRLSISSAPWYGGEIPAGQPKSFQFPLLEIKTDEGHAGHSMGYCPLGQGRGASYQLADIYPRILLGRNPLEHEALWQEMRLLHRHLYHCSEANSGVVDVALWDLKGKILNQPISVLLGLRRRSVGAYGTGFYFLHTPEEVAAEVRKLKARGYRGAKFNINKDVKTTIELCRAIRAEAGPDYPVMLDLNSYHNFQDALAIGREVDRLGFYWFEEPIYERHVGRLAELARQLDTPLLSAETSSFGELGEYLRTGAVDLVRSDVLIKPGVTGLKKTIDACEVMGVGCEIHTCASPLLDLANLQVAMATNSCPWVECHQDMFRFGMKKPLLDVSPDGLIHLPEGPGLGADLDWDWIENHTEEIIEGKSC
jgi:L-alanine-DL-glutamate epimerase-like enolase superfamily enzyme